MLDLTTLPPTFLLVAACACVRVCALLYGRSAARETVAMILPVKSNNVWCRAPTARPRLSHHAPRPRTSAWRPRPRHSARRCTRARQRPLLFSASTVPTRRAPLNTWAWSGRCRSQSVTAAHLPCCLDGCFFSRVTPRAVSDHALALSASSLTMSPQVMQRGV